MKFRRRPDYDHGQTPCGDPNGLSLRPQARVRMDDCRPRHRLAIAHVWFVIVLNAVLDFTWLFGLREA